MTEQPITEAEARALVRGLGPGPARLLLKIIRGKDPADVHVLLGPLRGQARSVEVVVPQKVLGEGEIPLDWTMS